MSVHKNYFFFGCSVFCVEFSGGFGGFTGGIGEPEFVGRKTLVVSFVR